MKKRCAINLTFSADLDMVKGPGDKPSDWIDRIRDFITSGPYEPEMVVNEIIEKRYAYVEGTGYVRPTFETAAERDMVLRANLDRIISALTTMQESDADLGHADEARLSGELIEQLKSFQELT